MGSRVDQFKSNLFMEAGLINWIWTSVSLNSIMVQIMFGGMLTYCKNPQGVSERKTPASVGISFSKTLSIFIFFLWYPAGRTEYHGDFF